MNRNIALALGVGFVFIALCAVMLAILPGPLGPKDFMVAGAISTILCLLLLLFLLTRTPSKAISKRTPPERSED
jgi:Na+-transporting methylmalonyl-CoA/oxaloacetate decarboxylase gamma subunit